MTRRSSLAVLAGGIASVAKSFGQQGTRAQDGPPVLNRYATIFDGVHDQLRPGNILVADRTIRQISSAAIQIPCGAIVIDAQNRFLMPGLTDARWHMTMATNTMADLEAADTGLMYANTVAEAQRTVLRGFTTVRDMAGPTFGIKAAIDAGVVPGLRVYPSGALI